MYGLLYDKIPICIMATIYLYKKGLRRRENYKLVKTKV